MSKQYTKAALQLAKEKNDPLYNNYIAQHKNMKKSLKLYKYVENIQKKKSILLFADITYVIILELVALFYNAYPVACIILWIISTAVLLILCHILFLCIIKTTNTIIEDSMYEIESGIPDEVKNSIKKEQIFCDSGQK